LFPSSSKIFYYFYPELFEIILPMTNYYILAINPGSTSTKIAVYENNKLHYLRNIKHEMDELAHFEKIADQYEFRKNIIVEQLNEAGIPLDSISLVMGRGGLLKPVEGGVYTVNEKMIRDIKNPMGEHESNLGGYIAYEIAKEIGKGVGAYIVDPTCVDEMEEIARISGLPELPRRSFLHALNQKAVARRYARENGKKYEEMNLIVAHMGGGTSVGAHCKGRIIDTNNGLNGDGPFSPERTGSLPMGQFAELCFSGKFTHDDIKKKIKGKGGLIAYLGTNNAVDIEERIEKGDTHAELVYRAMAYQVAKEIGAMATVLKGEVDAILLTGGIAFGKMIIDEISERVQHIAPVATFPGEDEMEALAFNGYLVLTGEIEPKDYE
jgi:butyrate kinase